MTQPRNEFVTLVEELHARVGYKLGTSPSLGSAERQQLWISLLREEVAELESGFLCQDIVQVADAIGDCIYVLVGAALAFGLPLELVFREIHRANMSKDCIAKTDAYDDGEEIKLHKGSNYVAPALERILTDYAPKH